MIKYINIQSVYDGVITKDFGDKPIVQLNFDDAGKIVSLKCAWYRSESFNDDLFLTLDKDNTFINEHGNLIGKI